MAIFDLVAYGGFFFILKEKREDIPFTGAYVLQLVYGAFLGLKSKSLLFDWKWIITGLSYLSSAIGVLSLLIGSWKRISAFIVPHVLLQVNTISKIILE